MFSGGSVRLIHGKITTSPANRNTAGLGRGSFKGTCSRNGKHLDRVRCSGSMANVEFFPAAYSSVEADGSPPLAGAGKSVLWYVNARFFSS